MPEQPSPAMMEEATSPSTEMQPASSSTMGGNTEGAMMDVPAWYSASLTNLNLDQPFTINDFKGKVVLVETMAQWCSNCKQQQQEVKALLANLGARDDFVAIALDIDPNEDENTLKTYAANNSFDWVYAVAPAEVSREISNLYGAQFVNPPSTPILVIDRSGEAHPLPFGIKSADDLMQSIQPYLENM